MVDFSNLQPFASCFRYSQHSYFPLHLKQSSNSGYSNNKAEKCTRLALPNVEYVDLDRRKEEYNKFIHEQSIVRK